MENFKVCCIPILYFLLISEVIISQSNLTFYAGVNISTSKFTSENTLTNIDSSGTLGSPYVRPILGVDIEFEISEKFFINTGLGVSMLGTKDYVNFDIPEGFNTDKNLKLDYLQVPVELKFELIDKMGISGGYALNYCYRKNINFFNFTIGSTSLSSKFNEVYHAANFGLFFRNDLFLVSVNYQIGLNRIWDTGNFYEEKRDYLNINALVIKLGYHLSDK